MADAAHSPTDAANVLRLGDLPVFTPDRSAINSHKLVGFDSRDIRARPFNLLR